MGSVGAAGDFGVRGAGGMREREGAVETEMGGVSAVRMSMCAWAMAGETRAWLFQTVN